MSEIVYNILHFKTPKLLHIMKYFKLNNFKKVGEIMEMSQVSFHKHEKSSFFLAGLIEKNQYKKSKHQYWTTGPQELNLLVTQNLYLGLIRIISDKVKKITAKKHLRQKA